MEGNEPREEGGGEGYSQKLERGVEPASQNAYLMTKTWDFLFPIYYPTKTWYRRRKHDLWSALVDGLSIMMKK